MEREWEEPAEPWRACLELAWDAYRAGTVPVGAVVVDPEGAIVSRGRNRIFERGSRLAHAEVEALDRLPLDRRYHGHTVYSLLEPCLLCLGAALLSTIGTIRYAASDPYGGACTAEIHVPDFLRRGMRLEGPLGGATGRLGSALQAAFWLGRDSPRAPEIAAVFDTSAGARIRALAGLPESFEEALPRLLDCL